VTVAIPVDFSLAAAIAARAAGGEVEPPSPAGLHAMTAQAEAAVLDYTGLEPGSPIPEPQWVTRREWAQLNLDSMQATLEEIGEVVGADAIPGPLRGPFAAMTGVQLGTLVGYASRKVLGQYEFPLLGPERSPRLVFVAANVSAAERELGGDRETLQRWIALHEVTHAVHFSSAPWLADHLRELARDLLTSSSLAISPRELGGTLKRAVSTDPRTLLRELANSDPVTLLTPPAARRTLASTQAAMASIEGFAEHVMDAAAPTLGDDITALRRRMEARRDRRPPLSRALGWLLGMELKLRQYRDGKRFCDAVAAKGGVDALNLAWRDAPSLPTIDEIAEPSVWLARVAEPATL
jgi:coenzyme F420 biosynthesis associated uncharacterized protein